MENTDACGRGHGRGYGHGHGHRRGGTTRVYPMSHAAPVAVFVKVSANV